ncbi:MAG TPA: ChbG/HpnK family deacetylase [Terracidiphilus sp.]|jgi:predicted glycoside hydrolase/deacetylase ChbG (UPF0249 family)
MNHASETRVAPFRAVILNADDWGRTTQTTDCIFDCVGRGAVSAVSAMVFMSDSERAACLAAQRGVDAGLHLNFTTTFSAPHVPLALRVHQGKLAGFLLSSRMARVVFHPGLIASFDYVVKAQLDEYERLYGFPAHRVDGHHHMHLCSNVVFQKLIPAGAIVRRNFSFLPEEKGVVNRCYRRWQDRLLDRRYQTTDYFFPLMPLDAERLRQIFAFAADSDVEIMTHPANREEYQFLLDGELSRLAREVPIAPGYSLRAQRQPSPVPLKPGDAAPQPRSAP